MSVVPVQVVVAFFFVFWLAASFFFVSLSQKDNLDPHTQQIHIHIPPATANNDNDYDNARPTGQLNGKDQDEGSLQDKDHRNDQGKKEKYLVLIPAFGPNNQYRGMKEAMVAAKLLGRTFVRPDFVAHQTKGPEGHRPFESTFQASLVSDFVPSISLSQFQDRSGTINHLVWTRKKTSFWDDELSNYLLITNLTVQTHYDAQFFTWNSNLKEDVNEKVYFSKMKSFVEYFDVLGVDMEADTIGLAFPFRNVDGENDNMILETAKSFERAEWIKNTAKLAWETMGASKDHLLAVHWRHGEQTCRVELPELHQGYDFCFGTSAYFWTKLTDFVEVIRGIMQEKGLTHVYLSTDSEDQVLYNRMKEILPIRRATDIPILSNITDNYYLSLVEQEICTQSKYFIASAQTTWSEFIINYWDSHRKFYKMTPPLVAPPEFHPPTIETIDSLLITKGFEIRRHNYWSWILKVPKMPSPECVYKKMDFAGMDLKNTVVDDSVECYNQCLEYHDCSCWSYKAATRGCYLKGPTCPDPVSGDPSLISGTKHCQVVKREGCYWSDTDYKGGDLTAKASIGSPQDCLQVCRSTEKCQCWTYDPTRSICWMKDQCNFLQDAKGFVSGRKECNISSS